MSRCSSRRADGEPTKAVNASAIKRMTRRDMKHPRATAAATIKAGNELFMPGGETDREDLLAALERGSAGRGPGGRIAPEDGGVSLTRGELEKQAARVIRAAWRIATISTS